MKKYAFILAALSACIVVSCNKEQPTVIDEEPAVDPQEETTEPEEQWQTITIKAIVDEDVTKTSYANGTTFNWTEGDEVSILASDEKFYTFTATSSGTKTDFTGSIPSGKTLGSYAFFPADNSHTNGHFNLPKYKDLTSHNSADIPMVGHKGTGDVYSFVHCAGAALLTIDNIPSGVTSATITVESAHASDPTHCIKLSGSFWIDDRETTEPYWSGAYAATDDEKQFSRKVPVSNHKAQVYVICPGGYNNTCPNKLTVTGHTSEGDVYLVTDKAMKKLGQVNRATVLPLTPLVLNNLSRVNWTDASVATSTLDSWQTSTVGLTRMDVVADGYYVYARLTGPSSAITSLNYIDVYLSDGEDGDKVWSDYWNSTGSVIYKKEHKGTISTSPLSLSMTFNSVSVTTDVEVSGDDTIWYMAFPRSAHSLLSSTGTVYFGLSLWTDWAITGILPSRRTWDHDSYLMAVSLP